MDNIVNIKYNPEPTPKRFHESDKPIRFLCGALGVGKTAGILWEPVALAINQEPFNGVRETKWVITRATYGELQSAVVDELQGWFPEKILKVKSDKPIRAYLKMPLPDGTLVKSTFIMMGMNRPDSYTKLRSINATGCIMNEADTQHRKVFTYGFQRSRRFPPKNEEAGFNGCTWGGLIGDYNPPSIRHWLYKDFVLSSMKDENGKVTSEVFHMEPPLYRVHGEKSGGFYCGDYTYFKNPKAEGVQYQTAGLSYWYGEISANYQDDNYIRRFVLGEYVPTFSGTPVFPEFCAEDHVAPKIIEPIRDKPILLAFDWGRSAACTISQTDDLGRLLFLDEAYDGDIVLSRFLREYLQPLLQKKYRGFSVMAIGDPSGGKGGQHDITPFIEVNNFFNEIKINAKCVPAIGKGGRAAIGFAGRREAVVYCLNRKDGCLFSPNMELTIDAMAGNYLFKDSTTNDGIEKEEPLKNDASHLADTVQYHCSYFKHLGDNEVGEPEGWNKRYAERHAARRRAR